VVHQNPEFSRHRGRRAEAVGDAGTEGEAEAGEEQDEVGAARALRVVAGVRSRVTLQRGVRDSLIVVL